MVLVLGPPRLKLFLHAVQIFLQTNMLAKITQARFSQQPHPNHDIILMTVPACNPVFCLEELRYWRVSVSQLSEYQSKIYVLTPMISRAITFQSDKSIVLGRSAITPCF